MISPLGIVCINVYFCSEEFNNDVTDGNKEGADSKGKEVAVNGDGSDQGKSKENNGKGANGAREPGGGENKGSKDKEKDDKDGGEEIKEDENAEEEEDGEETKAFAVNELKDVDLKKG